MELSFEHLKADPRARRLGVGQHQTDRFLMEAYYGYLCGHNVINSVMSVKMQMIGDAKCCRYTMVPR